MEIELIEENSKQCLAQSVVGEDGEVIDNPIGGSFSIIGLAVLLGAAIVVAFVVNRYIGKTANVSPNKGSVEKGENKVEIPVETGKNDVSVEILDGIISSRGSK